MKDIVAIPKGLSADVLAKAGAFTLWRLTGPVDYQKLSIAWIDAGLDPNMLPSPASEEVALRRASKDQARGSKAQISKLSDGGWAIIRARDVEASDGADVLFATELRVWLNDDDSLRFSPDNDARTGVIEEDYYRHQQELSTIDISGWLTQQMRRLCAVPLRESGGVYYMPPVAMEEWRAMIDVVRRCSSHNMYAVPALENDADTVALIVDGVTAEAEALIKVIGEQTSSEDTCGGERALKTRKEKLASLESKLGIYEKLLDASLDHVRDRLDEVDDEVSLALIEAVAEKDKKKADAAKGTGA